MATAKPGSGGGGIRPHPLVEKLAGDPSTPPHRLVRLVGYPGPAVADGATRLWLSLDFTDYVDIPNEKIAHCEFDEGNGPCTVFVAKGTKLELTSVTSTDVEADFLSGGITTANLPDSISELLTLRGDLVVHTAWTKRQSDFRFCRYTFLYQTCFTCFPFCDYKTPVKSCADDCLVVVPPHGPDPTTPVFIEIGRRVVEAGLNPQPLPPRDGPLTRPAG